MAANGSRVDAEPLLDHLGSDTAEKMAYHPGSPHASLVAATARNQQTREPSERLFPCDEPAELFPAGVGEIYTVQIRVIVGKVQGSEIETQPERLAGLLQVE